MTTPLFHAPPIAVLTTGNIAYDSRLIGATVRYTSPVYPDGLYLKVIGVYSNSDEPIRVMCVDTDGAVRYYRIDKVQIIAIPDERQERP